jgi:hypothetical protein
MPRQPKIPRKTVKRVVITTPTGGGSLTMMFCCWGVVMIVAALLFQLITLECPIIGIGTSVPYEPRTSISVEWRSLIFATGAISRRESKVKSEHRSSMTSLSGRNPLANKWSDSLARPNEHTVPADNLQTAHLLRTVQRVFEAVCGRPRFFANRQF